MRDRAKSVENQTKNNMDPTWGQMKKIIYKENSQGQK